MMDKLHEELRKQQGAECYDFKELTFSLINELANANNKLSDKSYLAFKKILSLPQFQGSDDFHLFIATTWDDGVFFDYDQLSEFKDWILECDFSHLQRDNEYSLCDCVAQVFSSGEAKAILSELAKKRNLEQAVRFALDELVK